MNISSCFVKEVSGSSTQRGKKQIGGKAPFSADTRDVIGKLKADYGCELTAADSHQLSEDPA